MIEDKTHSDRRGAPGNDPPEDHPSRRKDHKPEGDKLRGEETEEWEEASYAQTQRGLLLTATMTPMCYNLRRGL